MVQITSAFLLSFLAARIAQAASSSDDIVSMHSALTPALKMAAICWLKMASIWASGQVADRFKEFAGGTDGGGDDRIGSALQ